MKNLLILIALFLSSVQVNSAQSANRVIVQTTDNKNVSVRSDGKWEFEDNSSIPIEKNLEAVSSRGILVILKPDGTWESERHAEIFVNDKEFKKLEKERSKKEKEQKKNQEKELYGKLKQLEIDMDEVAKFPQNYINRTLRAKAIFFGEIEPYTEGGSETVYFINVKTRTGEMLFNFPTLNGVTFVIIEPMAHEMFAYYKKMTGYYSDYYPGHVLFDLIKFTNQNNQVYYFAKVRCIEFIGITGDKLQTLGSCSI